MKVTVNDGQFAYSAEILGDNLAELKQKSWGYPGYELSEFYKMASKVMSTDNLEITLDVKEKKITVLAEGGKEFDLPSEDVELEYPELVEKTLLFTKTFNLHELMPTVPDYVLSDICRHSDYPRMESLKEVYEALGSNPELAKDLDKSLKEEKIDIQHWKEIYLKIEELCEGHSDKTQELLQLFLLFRRDSKGEDDLKNVDRAVVFEEKGGTASFYEHFQTMCFSSRQLEKMAPEHLKKMKVSNLHGIMVSPPLEEAALKAHEKVAQKLPDKWLKGDDYWKTTGLLRAAVACPPLEEQILADQPEVTADWESFVVRKEGWSKGYNDISQEHYGSLMSLLTHYFATALEEKVVDLSVVLEKCALGRGAMACYLLKGQGNCNDVGIRRDLDKYIKGGSTPCNEGSIYKNLGDRLRDMFSKPYLVVGIIDEKKIPLSLINIQKDFVIIGHTKQEHIASVLKYVTDELSVRLMQETDSAKIMEDAGQIFWWICQAKPWALGDPSIAEMFVKALMLHKGLPLLPWKVGIVPWEETMLDVDPIAFGKRFHTLFEV